jgi:hypothetical protein
MQSDKQKKYNSKKPDANGKFSLTNNHQIGASIESSSVLITA